MNWHSMTAEDLQAVNAMAGRVHVNFPEDEAIFAERLRLYPSGCFALHHDTSRVGYIISHPWHLLKPPGLNELLNEIPLPASTYYIHDIALLPEARNSRAASVVVEALATHAASKNLPSMSLVAVDDSVRFWERNRFKVVTEPSLEEKLRSYDDDARFMVRDIQA